MYSYRVEKGSKVELCIMGSTTPIAGMITDIYQNLAGGVSVIFEPTKNLDYKPHPAQENSINRPDDVPYFGGESAQRPSATPGGNVLLSNRFRNSERTWNMLSDDKEAEQMAERISKTLGVPDQAQITMRMACKNDVRLFRLKQEVTNFIAQSDKRQREFLVQLQTLEKNITAALKNSEIAVERTIKLQQSVGRNFVRKSRRPRKDRVRAR